MRKYFGIHMLSRNSPNNAAWLFLKQRMGQEQSYADMIHPEDKEAIENYMASMSPEKQKAISKISEYVNTLPSEEKSKLTASLHNAYSQNAGKFSELLPPLHESKESNEVTKAFFVPIVIAAVFAADAVNTSQGADASFVGNVFADVGNTISHGAGGNPQMFGETNYGDIIEYNSPKGYVNPLTGTTHFQNEDAGTLERSAMGLVSGVGSFINPFSAFKGARAASKVRAPGKVSRLTQTGKVADDATASKIMGRKGNADFADEMRLTNYGSSKAPMDDILAEQVKTGKGMGRFGTRVKASKDTQRAKNIQDAIDANPQGFKNAQKYIDETGGMGTRGKINRLAGATYSPTKWGRFGNALGRNAYRLLQGNERMPNPINPFQMIFGQGPGDVPGGGNLDTSGFASGSSFSNTNSFAGGAGGGTAGGFGDGYGMGNVSNIDSNMSQRREVWNPYADYSTTRGQTLAGRGMGDPGSFGGFGKGDTMKIGERMLKDATELMYNRNTVSKEDDCCPNCGEKVGKMGCMKMGCGGMNKADKKPAGGMVIVIGSKAGPGPSKDGKREKLDSEKDKKE